MQTLQLPSDMKSGICHRMAPIRHEVGYLPSNGATANVVHHDFDLRSRGHEKIEM